MSRVEAIGAATLYHARCEDVLPKQPRGAVVVSDPPYGIGYCHAGSGSPVSNVAHQPNGGRSFHRHSKPIAGDSEPFSPEPLMAWPCLLFGGNHFYSRLPDGGTFHVWDKHCGRGTDDNFSDAEFFWTSWRCKSEVFRFLWKGVLKDGQEGRERRVHPSQKPVALMRFCIGMTKVETIIDPYMGSGSTGVAALRMGRSFIGIECDAQHFSTACHRIEAAYKQADLFVAPPAKAEQLVLA
jgi:site-specific DNA-methyltransferase (adenine-specific)